MACLPHVTAPELDLPSEIFSVAENTLYTGPLNLEPVPLYSIGCDKRN